MILKLDEIFERSMFNSKRHFGKGFQKYNISGVSPGIGAGLVKSLTNAHGLGFKQGLRSSQIQSQSQSQSDSNIADNTPQDDGDSNDKD